MVQLTWDRSRLFHKSAVQSIFSRLQENPEATIIKVDKHQKNKSKPYPLNTIEMQKLVSRKLFMGSAETMKIAEKLY